MAEREKKDPNWVKELPATEDLVVGTSRGVLVRIKPDGTLEYGPEYQPDEAAEVFWSALAKKREAHDEQRLISQHVEALVERLGAADMYAEQKRLEAVRLAGSNREGSVVLEADQAVQVLERIIHQLIELGRGLARRPDVKFIDIPSRVPNSVANNPLSSYEPSELPDDSALGVYTQQVLMELGVVFHGVTLYTDEALDLTIRLASQSVRFGLPSV